MEEESILKKMERLFKMRRLLKEKKLKRIKDKKLKYGRWDLDDEDDDYDYEDELLSRPELIEEALKEYRGTILLICHEPEFYRDIVQEVWDCTRWAHPGGRDKTLEESTREACLRGILGLLLCR